MCSKFYKNCALYLEKVQETNKKELSKLMWIVIFLLVVAKQQIGTLAIAFVIFIILIGFTHFIDAAYVRGQVLEKQLNQAILAVCK